MTGGGMEGFVDAPSQPVDASRDKDGRRCMYDAQGNFVCVRDDDASSSKAFGASVGSFSSSKR